MTRIWRYVVKTNSGMAPCVEDGLLSLACCKPFIRRHARKGDWVIGFAPKRSGLGHILWAGCVSDVITLGDYQKKFPDRDDAIYRTGVAPDGSEILEPLRQDYHEKPEIRRRDIRGVNALVFGLFAYAGRGKTGIPAPEPLAALAHYYVGQSARGSSPERVDMLSRWVQANRHSGNASQHRAGASAVDCSRHGRDCIRTAKC